MSPFHDATYSELNRLLKLVEEPPSPPDSKTIDYDWFLSWADGDPKTHTNMSTSAVISNFEGSER